MAPPPPPPTAVETVTEGTSSLKLNASPSDHSSESNATNLTNFGENLINRYRVYLDDKAPFDFPEANDHADIGASPYAEKPNEGPSVLTSYTPQRTTGKLDNTYKYTETTPRLGREYKNVKVADLLKDEELLHDLAVTISERGVVFLRDQLNISVEEQKQLTRALAKAANFPAQNSLHIHPATLTGGILKENDDKIDVEVNYLNSQLQNRIAGRKLGRTSDDLFHSDITFEPVPAGFSLLRIVETPSGNGTKEELSRPGGGPVGGSGGDTLWANGYALAEKVSPSFLKYLETLNGEYYQPKFGENLKRNGIPIYTGIRGAPENIGDYLTAVHPIVRTNPVTGWKSIFAVGHHFNRVIGVTDEESDLIKKYLNDLLYESPEIQLRFKWDAGDLAIWDNRSTYHSAIFDLYDINDEVENRTGLRTIAIAERPFLDPNSKTQIEGLRERAQEL